MGDIVTMVKFAALMLGAILGVSCFIMTALLSIEGQSDMKQKIEYGFFGVAGIALAALMSYALA